MSQKYVYLFSEGNGSMRELLGGKGANLAEMTNLGLPVPQGFVVTTEACNKYYDDGQVMSQDVVDQIFANVAEIEALSGKKFGDASNPLLLSVRSGSRASMPGMMDTILNLGLNDEVVESLAKLSGNPRFAYDSYRRFIQMFADVVMESPALTTSRNSSSCSPCTSIAMFRLRSLSVNTGSIRYAPKTTAKVGGAMIAPYFDFLAKSSSR